MEELSEKLQLLASLIANISTNIVDGTDAYSVVKTKARPLSSSLQTLLYWYPEKAIEQL